MELECMTNKMKCYVCILTDPTYYCNDDDTGKVEKVVWYRKDAEAWKKLDYRNRYVEMEIDNENNSA